MDTTPSTGTNSKVALIKTLYLYLVSFVALIIIVISTVDLISVLLKTYILTKADRYNYSPIMNCDGPKPVVSGPGEPLPASALGSGLDSPTHLPLLRSVSPEECRLHAEQQKTIDEENRVSDNQRDLARGIPLLVVGIPLFIGHWRLARRKE